MDKMDADHVHRLLCKHSVHTKGGGTGGGGGGGGLGGLKPPNS